MLPTSAPPAQAPPGQQAAPPARARAARGQIGGFRARRLSPDDQPDFAEQEKERSVEEAEARQAPEAAPTPRLTSGRQRARAKGPIPTPVLTPGAPPVTPSLESGEGEAEEAGSAPSSEEESAEAQAQAPASPTTTTTTTTTPAPTQITTTTTTTTTAATFGAKPSERSATDPRWGAANQHRSRRAEASERGPGPAPDAANGKEPEQDDKVKPPRPTLGRRDASLNVRVNPETGARHWTDPLYDADPERQKAINDWCVEGQDDPQTVAYLVCDTKSKRTPENADVCAHQAEGQLAILKTSPTYVKRGYDKIEDKHLLGVIVYSTNAAYPMNAIRRKLITSAKWTKAYGHLFEAMEAGLAVLPEGTRNQQGYEQSNPFARDQQDEGMVKLDPDKGVDELLPITTLYRGLEFKGGFTSYFADNYRIGATLVEDGFASGCLDPKLVASGQVLVTIENVPDTTRAVADISCVKGEAEAIIPPGQAFGIASITVTDSDLGGPPVGVFNPAKTYDGLNGRKHFKDPSLTFRVVLECQNPNAKLTSKGKPKDDDKGKGRKRDKK